MTPPFTPDFARMPSDRRKQLAEGSQDWAELPEDITGHCMKFRHHEHEDGRGCWYHARLDKAVFLDDGRWLECLRPVPAQPDTADEALARAFCGCGNTGHARQVRQECDYSERAARAVLASDWLAHREAAARAEALREAAQEFRTNTWVDLGVSLKSAPKIIGWMLDRAASLAGGEQA